jgi:hypothetical protein
MRKKSISWLLPMCLSWALPVGAATYDYYLQVPALPQAGVSAWTAAWSSNTLSPPVCSSISPLTGAVSPVLVGAPITGYSAVILFCINVTPGGNVPTVLAYWQNLSAAIANYTFTSSTAPFTTGVFTLNGGTLFVDNPTTATFNSYNGPNATLTIAKAVSFPPIPRWLGSIVRVSLTTAGPVTPLPGSPVEAQVGFVDLNGNAIGQFAPVSITPGQISTFELDPGTSPVAFGHHTAVVPVVSAPPGQVLPPLQLTTEVLDSLTGFGAVLTTATGLAPPPASFSPQGLAAAQVMRLTATAIPTDPCNATLSFANAQGVVVGPSLTVNLTPGQSQSLDLTSAMLNVPLGKSVLVQPNVALQVPISAAGLASPACIVSSDVFDVIANRTWTYQVANVQ